jgi:hypothetical protein
MSSQSDDALSFLCASSPEEADNEDHSDEGRNDDETMQLQQEEPEEEEETDEVIFLMISGYHHRKTRFFRVADEHQTWYHGGIHEYLMTLGNLWRVVVALREKFGLSWAETNS